MYMPDNTNFTEIPTKTLVRASKKIIYDVKDIISNIPGQEGETSTTKATKPLSCTNYVKDLMTKKQLEDFGVFTDREILLYLAAQSFLVDYYVKKRSEYNAKEYERTRIKRLEKYRDNFVSKKIKH